MVNFLSHPVMTELKKDKVGKRTEDKKRDCREETH